jgi:hypothetical protein
MARVKAPPATGEYDEARARGDAEAIYDARSASFDGAENALVLVLHSGVKVTLPLSSLPWIRDAGTTDLENLELLGGGDTIDWPALNVSVTVSQLVREAIGLTQAQRRGGSAKTPAKTAAARANGGKGGRPRKTQAPTKM